MIGVAKRLQNRSMGVEECRSLYDSLMQDTEYMEYTVTSTADEKQIKGRIGKAVEHFA